MLNVSLSKALHALSQGADRVIETSCATVVLRGDEAFKLKKSVDFGFLDFSTAEKRREALMRELQFNRRAAPDIYREVIAIDGESVLVMRRFDTTAVLGEQSLGTEDWAPDLTLMQELGETVAEFHAQSVVCRDRNHLENIKYTIDSNRKNIALFGDELGADVAAYEREILAAYEGLRPDIGARFEAGCMRHCHGDLHLGNILIEAGRPVLFDCIEFNEHLMQVDVLYDLAFLLMDLWVRGHRTAANRVMNAWLDRAARLEGEAGLYEGLKLLPLYMSARAGVRCHVVANVGEMDKARRYLEAARQFLHSADAAISAVGGLSGSGKSTYSRAVAAHKGRAPGAVVLRSDELRKRLWRWPPYEALPAEAYQPEESARVHAHMFSLGETAARAGQAVIFDATFRDKALRDQAEAAASEAEVSFDGTWLEAGAALRAQRVAARLRDVSDATVEVAAGQEGIDPATISWQIIRMDARSDTN